MCAGVISSVEMSSRSLGLRSDVRVPGQVFARELPLDQFGIFGEEKDSSLQSDHVRALFDFAFEERIDHVEPRRNQDWGRPERNLAGRP
jgi:hypothetical protein